MPLRRIFAEIRKTLNAGRVKAGPNEPGPGMTGWENTGYQYGMDREATPLPSDPQVHEPVGTDRGAAGRGVRRAAEDRERQRNQQQGGGQ